MVTSLSRARPAVTWSKPSAPTPVWRWQTARASAGVTGMAASRSINTRKSLPRPWCLVSCMRGSSLPGHDALQRRQYVDRIVLGREPLDPWVPPEPGPLAPGELPRAPYGFLQGRLQVEVAAQVGEQLAVSQCLRSGPRQPARSSRQPANLVEQARVELCSIAVLDSGVDHCCREADADETEGRGRVGLEPGAVRRER